MANKTRLIHLLLSVLVYTSILIVDARKTFIIKEKINSGELKVYKPRVMAAQVTYCWFKDLDVTSTSSTKDTLREFCYEMDQSYKLGWENK